MRFCNRGNDGIVPMQGKELLLCNGGGSFRTV